MKEYGGELRNKNTKLGMYVRVSSESGCANGWKEGELAALGSLLCWGFPQVALRKFADWLTVTAQSK